MISMKQLRAYGVPLCSDLGHSVLHFVRPVLSRPGHPGAGRHRSHPTGLTVGAVVRCCRLHSSRPSGCFKVLRPSRIDPDRPPAYVARMFEVGDQRGWSELYAKGVPRSD